MIKDLQGKLSCYLCWQVSLLLTSRRNDAHRGVQFEHEEHSLGESRQLAKNKKNPTTDVNTLVVGAGFRSSRLLFYRVAKQQRQ